MACYDFYGSGEFSEDEFGGYKYCTWCGNGGELYMCDYCPNGFCSACIQRSFGVAEISEIMKEKWQCYICNKKRMKPKVKFCDLIISFKSKSAQKKDDSAGANKAVIKEAWLNSTFEESEQACKTFCREMAELRTVGIGKDTNFFDRRQCDCHQLHHFRRWLFSA